jgi:tRNA A-37 threonylcarbamoyl transferase component Bud32
MSSLPPELAGPQALERAFACRPTGALREVPGRATFVWPDAADVIVKRYASGDVRDAWADLLRARVPRSAARREADNLQGLARSGLPVPRALGAWEERAVAWRRRSALAMERIEHDLHLRQVLERDPASARRWVGPLADLVARLHGFGWYHRDLYLQHFALVPAASGRPESLVLLDVGRARRSRRPARRWLIKDLAALLHSCPAAVSVRARLGFLARYLELTGRTERRARREFARDVLRKAARMARHVPRDLRGSLRRIASASMERPA